MVFTKYLAKYKRLMNTGELTLFIMSEEGAAILREIRNSDQRWFHEHQPQWKYNPFAGTEMKDSRMFTGYRAELKRFISYVDRGESTFITGPVGIGKSSFIKHATGILPPEEFRSIYIERPPKGIKDVFHAILQTFDRDVNDASLGLLRTVVSTLTEFNAKVKTILILDELGDSGIDVLKWLRTLFDSAELTPIISGPSETLGVINQKHFPLADRVFKTILLGGFNKEETYEFVNRRIRSVCIESDFNGGKTTGICSGEKGNCTLCYSPFTADTIDELYSTSGGNPRLLLQLSGLVMDYALANRIHKLQLDDVIRVVKSRNQALYGNLTPSQKEIIQVLLKKGPATSVLIADSTKSSVGSTLNQLNELVERNIVLRSGTTRSFEYTLTPEMQRYLQKGV